VADIDGVVVVPFHRIDEVINKLDEIKVLERELDVQVAKGLKARVYDLLCMSKLAHASKLKEHDDNDDFQGTTGRAA
jgi:regulator of RNase E activity RraA